jgi:hypothetical protein
VFIDHAQWVAAGEPAGFLWGVCWSNAYPGLTYVDESARAGSWSQRLGKPMHEICLETEAFKLNLIFHDFTVTKLSDDIHILDTVMLPLKFGSNVELG